MRAAKYAIAGNSGQPFLHSRGMLDLLNPTQSMSQPAEHSECTHVSAHLVVKNLLCANYEFRLGRRREPLPHVRETGTMVSAMPSRSAARREFALNA